VLHLSCCFGPGTERRHASVPMTCARTDPKEGQAPTSNSFQDASGLTCRMALRSGWVMIGIIPAVCRRKKLSVICGGMAQSVNSTSRYCLAPMVYRCG